jgi:hypothetical protein
MGLSLLRSYSRAKYLESLQLLGKCGNRSSPGLGTIGLRFLTIICAAALGVLLLRRTGR